MKLEECLEECERILFKGFVSPKINDKIWLNNFRTEFQKFHEEFLKFMQLECEMELDLLDTGFLCLTQIDSCVKCLENTIQKEIINKVLLSETRQYFVDRILWCFSRIKPIIDNTDSCNSSSLMLSDELNFVTTLDTVLDLLCPYSALEREKITNKAEYDAEAMFCSNRIRELINVLLSQALALAEVVVPKDSQPLVAFSKKVLEDCIAFQEECALDKCVGGPNEYKRHLKAAVLESSLFRLENIINDSLLKLVVIVMLNRKKGLIDKIRKFVCENNEVFNQEIKTFHRHIERIVQIGLFAVAFSSDSKLKTMIRSCLASLESLNTHLIISIKNNCKLHSAILEEHYNEEVTGFLGAIHKVIDSTAFCAFYVDTYNEYMDSLQKNFDLNALEDILEKGKILGLHLRINAEGLELCSNSIIATKYAKFESALNDCITLIRNGDRSSIKFSKLLKRLKCFETTIKKLHKSMSNNTKKDDLTRLGDEDLKSALPCNGNISKSTELSDLSELRDSFGISPSETSILYKTRDYVSISASMKANTSKIPVQATIRGQKFKKRVSLRVAMFKRQKTNETKNIWNSYNEKSFSLNITDILDEMSKPTDIANNVI